MVQEQEQPEVDVLDQEQIALDNEQQIQQPAYVTAEQLAAERNQFRTLIEQQSRMIQGLQSKIDTGLNAIRRDTQEQARQQLEEQRRATQQQLINSIEDPEQRQVWRQYFETENATRDVQAQSISFEPDVTQQVDPGQAYAGYREQLYQTFEAMGIERSNPAIQPERLYAAGSDPIEQRRVFGEMVRSAYSQNVSTPRAAQGTRQRQAPPVEAAPAASSGYRNIDDVRDALLTDRITIEQAQELAQRMRQAL